jgi:branched-subunit amino acid transport protein
MSYIYFSVLIMAFVTYVIRVLPITIFRKEIKSTFVKSFLQYVPFSVLGALTFPDIFYSTGNYKTALFGTAIALFLSYKGKSLAVVALGAILTVYITGLFFG